MADAHFGGLRPWEMGRLTLQEYVGLHYYRRNIENPE